MGFINLGRLKIRKRNSCASALVSLSDVQPSSVYKSHIFNGSINKLYLSYNLFEYIMSRYRTTSFALLEWAQICIARRFVTPMYNICSFKLTALQRGRSINILIGTD